MTAQSAKRTLPLLAVALPSLVLIGYGGYGSRQGFPTTPTPQVGVRVVTANVAREALRVGPVFVLDVRPADAYAAGHLPDAVNIHAYQMPAHRDRLPADRSTPILLICDRTAGSDQEPCGRAARHLLQWGFTDIRLLRDRVTSWRAHGLPLVAAPGPATGRE